MPWPLCRHRGVQLDHVAEPPTQHDYIWIEHVDRLGQRAGQAIDEARQARPRPRVTLACRLDDPAGIEVGPPVTQVVSGRAGFGAL